MYDSFKIEQPKVIRKDQLYMHIAQKIEELTISPQYRHDFIDDLWKYDILEYRHEDLRHYAAVKRRTVWRLKTWYADAKRCTALEQMDKHKGDLADLKIRDGRWDAKLQELDAVENLLHYISSEIDFEKVKAELKVGAENELS